MKDRDVSIVRRSILSLVLAASLIVALVYYVSMTGQVTLLSMGKDANLIGVQQQKRPEGASALQYVSALAADPLSQQAVNGVIAAQMRATGDTRQAMQQILLLRQLGWRNNSALQNMLWRAGTVGDLPMMMDTLDALLRREKLLGQIYPILNLMTTDASFRALLIQRLKNRPSWSKYYFQSASDLSRPAEIEGRFLVMRSVQRTGGQLSRNEIAPILPKLIGMGAAPQAFELWQAQDGAVMRPLDDANFLKASRPTQTDALPIPFEWQLGSGSGYFTDAGRDEHGTFLSIDWNGRGAPALASQLTSATPGRYRIIVVADHPATQMGDRLGFRFACANGTVVNFTAVKPSTRNQVQFVSNGPLTCSYPELQIYGLVQNGSSATSVIMRSIKLERINS